MAKKKVESIAVEIEVIDLDKTKSYLIVMIEDCGKLSKDKEYNVAGNLASKLINNKKAVLK